MPEAEALQPQVTAWEIADVEVGDIVVVRYVLRGRPCTFLTPHACCQVCIPRG